MKRKSTAISTPAKKKRATTENRLLPKYRQLSVPRNVASEIVGFPTRLNIKHRYVDSFNLVSSAGTLAVYKFACNGMYDPDITGVGHQPMYFDNLNALYNHYTVTRSWITIEGNIVTAATDSPTVLFGCYIDDDATTTATSASTMCEEHSAVYKVIPLQATESVKISKHWEAGQYFGRDVIGNDNLQGTGSSNPAELSVFTVFLQGNTAATDARFNGTVTITYEAQWEELKPQGQN